MTCIFNENECKITWNMVMTDKSIKSVYEPVCEMCVPKKDFDQAYSTFLITLDGSDMTSFVDFFWQRSPTDNSCLEFIDNDSRLDIYDYFREHNLVPDMNKVHDGSWKFQPISINE